jgi:RNA polymerase sigma-70 factor, ECF subfamily
MSGESESERREAFEIFYRSHHPAVSAYARRRTTEISAQDVVADTFLAAWRRFDEAAEAGLPWLYRTAHLTLCNLERSRHRQERRELRIASQPLVGGDDPQDGWGDRDALVAGVAELSPDDRELVFLVYWEQIGIKSAARVLGCSAPAASVRLHRIRRRLRQAITSADTSPVNRIARTTTVQGRTTAVKESEQR